MLAWEDPSTFFVSCLLNAALGPMRPPGGHHTAAQKLQEAADLNLGVSNLPATVDGLLVASDGPMQHLVSKKQGGLEAARRPPDGKEAVRRCQEAAGPKAETSAWSSDLWP
jgi:hypothetical protein